MSNLLDAKFQFKELYKDEKWFAGIGIGDDHLRVYYIGSPKELLDSIPETFMGFRVERIYVRGSDYYNEEPRIVS